MDLNIFERNNNNSNGFIKEFIRDLKNALKNMMDEGKGMNENDKVLEEYNLYERRKMKMEREHTKVLDFEAVRAIAAETPDSELIR